MKLASQDVARKLADQILDHGNSSDEIACAAYLISALDDNARLRAQIENLKKALIEMAAK